MVKEGREHQSELMKERWRDPEWRAFMAERVRLANKTRAGTPQSEATKRKISAALVGHGFSEDARNQIAATLRQRGVPDGIVVPEGMKYCRGCEKVKPLDAFHKASRARDGRQSRCKSCKRAAILAKSYEPRTEGDKYCAKCGRTLPVSEFHKDRRRKDGLAPWCKDCNKAQATAWNNRNVEYKRAYMAQWQRDNPDKANARNHRRRARELDAPGDGWTSEQWQALVAHYAPDGRCLACGKKRNLTVDHVVMLQDGGANDITNLQPLCRSCNSKKESRDYRPDGGEFGRELV